MNITKNLTKLQTNQAYGPDRIGSTVLKSLPSSSKSLLLIFKTALNKGFFPSYWKISELIPIFQDENRAKIEQNGPISLLCSISKVLEELILDELFDIVKKAIR